MTEERLYDLATIAKALGITQRAVTNRANKGRKGTKSRPPEAPWKVHSTEKRRGQATRLFAYNDLPTDIQQALDKYEAAEREARAIAEQKERARLSQLQYEREMAECGKSLADAEQEKTDKERQARMRRIEEGIKRFGQLPKDDPKRIRANALLYVIEDCGDYRRRNGIRSAKTARIEYCAKLASGELTLPLWVDEQMPRRRGKRHVVEPTLRGWGYTYKNDGIWGLTPGWGNRKGKSKIDDNPGLYRLVVGALIKYPQITAASVKQFLKAEHPELDIVSKRSIQRFFTAWKEENAQIWTYITHPDKWKNIYMAGVGSVFEMIERPNQLWEMDSTPGDWLLTDGRHSVVGCIDMYSRRVKLFVSKSSTAAAVKQVLRRAMLDWGIPEAVRTDNGKDYVSEAVSGLLRDLEVIQEICIPFASEEKGTIERFFHTMSHGVLNLLDGFIGHSVADRKAIESRKSFAQRVMKKDEVVEVQMSSSELQEKLDDWVEHYYEQSPHGGLDGKSPREIWRAWTQPLRKISDEHALDELMAEIGGTRVIGKKGIRYDNRFFFDPEGQIFAHVGEEVTLKLDEQDMGRLAVYLDGAFFCWVEDPDMTGLSRREHAKAIKHSQKKLMNEQAAELKKYTKEIKQNPAQAIIEYRKEQSKNILEIPRRTEEYSTTALEAASEASKARSDAPPPLAEDERLAEQQTTAEIVNYDRFRDEFEAHNRKVVEEDDERRIHAYWLRVDEAISAGHKVRQEDRRGLEIYKQSGLWQSMQDFFASFGLTAASFPE